MNLREDLTELECLAKVGEVQRGRLKKGPTKQRPKNREAEDASSPPDADVDTQGTARLWKLPHLASWKELSERVMLRAVQVLVGCYAIAAFAAWIMLHSADESWSLFTLLLLGPRWVALLPLVILVPAAVVLRIRLLFTLCVPTLFIFFGLMDFQVPWPWKGGSPDTPGAVRTLTCNVGGETRHWSRIRQLIEEQSSDIVALQESSPGMLLVFPKSWHVAMDQQLLLAARFPIEQSEVCRGDDTDPKSPPLALYAQLQTPGGPLGVVNLQLESLGDELMDVMNAAPQTRGEKLAALQAVLRRQSEQSQRVAQWAGQLPRVDMVLTSFNAPQESRAYQCWQNYRNAFCRAGHGLGNTQRVAAQGFYYGLRTDHILLGDTCQALTCQVGSLPGSEHLPVFASVQFGEE